MDFQNIDDLQINYETKIYDTFDDWSKEELMQKKEKDLVIIHINIRNLTISSFNTLQIYLENKMDNLDIIILTETNCKREEMNLFQLQKFNMTYFCREKKKGGGIIIYSKENLLITEKKNIEFNHTENIEIEIDNKNILINALYRPPKTNIKEFLKELKRWLKHNDVKNKDLIIIGDLNINTLKDDINTQTYFEILSNEGIINTIKKPTREEIMNKRLTQSCIDHINIRSKKKYTTAIVHEKIADHYFICAKIEEMKKNQKENIVEIKIIDEEKIDAFIREYDWESLIAKYENDDNNDIENIYHDFVNVFQSLYKQAEKSLKIKEKYVGNTWITKEIRDLIKLKNLKFKELKRNSDNTSILNDYKKLKNHITNKITQAKRKEYGNTFKTHHGNMKKTWETIDKIRRKTRKNIETTILNNFKKTNKSLDIIANDFNKNFKSEIIDLKINKDVINTDITFMRNNNLENNDDFKFNLIENNELFKIIKEFNINKGPGFDMIRPREIKNNYSYLREIIKFIINQIIIQGKIPSLMKISKICPVYKKGKKDNISNYRPIAVLPCIEKILEKHMNNELSKYVEDNNILNTNQHGFRKGKSTTTLLNRYVDDIKEALNHNKFCLTVSLDLKKAYDTIDHKNMLKILNMIPMKEESKALLQNFFEERKQFVKIGKYKSENIEISSGLITGGIISPLLFNLYVNDIHNIGLETNILQYADDTLLYYISETKTEAYIKIQNDFNKICVWLNKKDIFLNKEKTISILFENPMATRFRNENENCVLKIHSNKCIDDKSINNCQCMNIKNEETMKYLGIHFERNLKWKTQAHYIKNRLNSIAFQLHHYKKILPIYTKILIYKTLCESILTYGIESYGYTSEENLKPIKSIHKKILKSTLYPFTSRTQRKEKMKEYNILNFKNLHKFLIITRHYYDQNYRQVQSTSYNTRHIHYLTPHITNNYGRATIKYQVTYLLNSLPETLKDIQNIHQMKRKIKEYLLLDNDI